MSAKRRGAVIVRHHFVRLMIPDRRPRRSGSQFKKGYQIVAVSLYDEDVTLLDWTVSKLARDGHDGVSRSAAVRWALRRAHELTTAARGRRA